jgi:hypothetical protein
MSCLISSSLRGRTPTIFKEQVEDVYHTFNPKAVSLSSETQETSKTAHKECTQKDATCATALCFLAILQNMIASIGRSKEWLIN